MRKVTACQYAFISIWAKSEVVGMVINMIKKQLRQQELMKIIERRGINSIKTLSNMLNVSEMTIRRDFKDIKARMEDTQADATKSETDMEGNDSQYNLFHAMTLCNVQKNKIGQFAASLIVPNDVIILDVGTTTAQILPHIPEDKNLTILCITANALTELRHKQGIHLLISGGVYHPNSELFESPEGIHFIQSIRATKVFLSAAGIHQSLGLTCENVYEVTTKKSIINSSLERILVADSSKFGKLCSSYFCDLSVIHTIVTDSNLSEEWRNYIVGRGIMLHMVD